MAEHPLNLAVRFGLEIAALVAYGVWGWHAADGALRLLLAAGLPVLAATLWGALVSPRAAVAAPGAVVLAVEALIFTEAHTYRTPPHRCQCAAPTPRPVTSSCACASTSPPTTRPQALAEGAAAQSSLVTHGSGRRSAQPSGEPRQGKQSLRSCRGSRSASQIRHALPGVCDPLPERSPAASRFVLIGQSEKGPVRTCTVG